MPPFHLTAENKSFKKPRNLKPKSACLPNYAFSRLSRRPHKARVSGKRRIPKGGSLWIPKILSAEDSTPHPHSLALGNTGTKDRKGHRKMAIFPGLKHHVPPPLPLCPHPTCFYGEQFPLSASETAGWGSCDLAHQPHTGRKCTPGVLRIPHFSVCVCVPPISPTA